MKRLKSFLVRFTKFVGRQTADLAESVIIGLFSIAAFVALFWFDECWKSIASAIPIFFAVCWLPSEPGYKIAESAGILPPFCRHCGQEIKKPLRGKWLFYMILKQKFGGPCWV
ncbi:hypothetical protein [Serratia marcescens]|uniref:hypothetical protein n=1 Tax=Serratia marcescens TaxID=615 RepID=UPI00277A4316|nr:hypothetical protein [Serratia marcescens]MDP8746215.1 hypothetical protein [Serratia marcescens]HEJ7840731.1 hypothetical protein [Serratia marcescens]HEJ7842525.1 hypothetical protein [Serratia marcescens]